MPSGFRLRLPIRRPSLALLAVVAIGPVAGCGDAGPTKAQYTARANALCARISKQIGPKLEAYDAAYAIDTSDEGQEKQLAAVLLPVLERVLEQLRALDRPAADDDELDDLFDAYEEALERTKEDPGLYFRSAPLDAPEEALDRYGLTRCG
jgi:broad specificity phosphatase PhoE